MIKNLDSIKVSYARVDLGGVVRKCGSSLEFTGKAYDAIIAHYEENYLQSKGVFAVYMADNNWNYSKVWECPLDFATLQYDANVATIGCVDNSAAAIIKANKKSKYEFDVSSIMEPSKLRYDGVRTEKDITFSVIGTPGQDTEMHDVGQYVLWGYNLYSFYVPGIYAQSENLIEAIEIIEDGQRECNVDQFNTSIYKENAVAAAVAAEPKIGFLRCLEACVVHITMDMDFWIDSWLGGGVIHEWTEYIEYEYLLISGNRILWSQTAVCGNNSINIDSDFQIYPNEKLAFVLAIRNIEEDDMLIGRRVTDYASQCVMLDVGMHWYSNTHTAKISESHYEDDPIEIKAVKPLSLLQNLIDKMFATREDICVLGRIEEGDNLLSRTLLVAAESIRKITTNKIYSSFTQFCDFMEVVFGYVYTLESVGYLMDRELQEIDKGTRTTLSHIRASSLTSRKWTIPESDNGTHDRMYICTSITSDDLGDLLDLETEYNVGRNELLGPVIYNEYANVFVVKDNTTGKYYANFVGEDLFADGSMFNDETGHAREMIGLRLNYYSDSGLWDYAIIRNGKLVRCDAQHPIGWLDNAENNKECVELIFRHRRDIFKSDTIKSLFNVNNLSFQLDDSKVFSDVEVGYSKVDYDNANSGLNEFNFTNYYKTDSDLTEQTLSLICPYRADCYGIEELLIKSNNSESTDSDNDIFIVVASASQPVDGCWRIDRSITVQNAYSETVFNAAIAPNKIIRNNEEYIGSCAKILKFTSSDANSSAIIGGTSMHANINITKQLFKVGKISIDTDDHSFPETWDGLIEFAYAGKTYKGYLDSIDICFANMGTITYNLIEKCIE